MASATANTHDDNSVHYPDEEDNGHHGGVTLLVSQSAGITTAGGLGIQGADLNKSSLARGKSIGFGSSENIWLPVVKLEAKQFCARLDLYSGTMVQVFVGSEKTLFEIPKAMLVHHSKFFERALTGPYIEAQELRVTLEEDKVEAFELLVQWMYSGSYVLAWCLDLPGQIGVLLDFLKLVDKLHIVSGNLAAITAHLRSLLVTSRSVLPARNSCRQTWETSSPCQGHPMIGSWGSAPALSYCIDESLTDADPLRDNILQSEHLRAAFALPKGHEARLILVDACVISYMLRGGQTGGWGAPRPFKFQKELDTIEGFSCELLQGVQRAIHFHPLEGGRNAVVVDPLTGKAVTL